MPMPSSKSIGSDILVLGGGTNGLACAARLAGVGHRVTVLEAEATTGGGARGWEFAPGFRTPGLAQVLHLLDPRVVKGMGLKLDLTPLPSVALSVLGDHLTFGGTFGAILTGASEAEAKAWAALRAKLLRFAAVLAPMKQMAPPRLASGAGNETLKLLKLALKMRLLGADDFRELLRMLLINVWDVLEDELTDPRLKGLLAFDATLGSWLGPRSPNSLILLLNRLAGEVEGRQAALALPKGGMEAMAQAMTDAAKAAGVTVRTGAKVARIVVENDRATGVVLETGEQLRASGVISALNPKITLLSLVGPRHLDNGLVTRLRHQKSRGAAAKLHLALTGQPDFRGADLKARLVIAPSSNAVESAFNPVKYGEVPTAPVMEILLPSLCDPALAPTGHHVLTANVQYAPHAPKVGANAARAQMLEACLTQLETYAPGLRARVAHAELLMPYDIEARFGMPGGNWHHGELSVEQMLFLRPLAELAQYHTPIDGLWLAGAGSHPGGGISGAAGWNAAEAVLKGAKA